MSNEADYYRLSVADFRDGLDRFLYSNNMQFSSKDKDRDKNGSGKCAVNRKGGFWYNNCGVLFPHSEASGIQPEGVCMGLYPGNGAGMVCSKTFQLLMRRKK